MRPQWNGCGVRVVFEVATLNPSRRVARFDALSEHAAASGRRLFGTQFSIAY